MNKGWDNPGKGKKWIAAFNVGFLIGLLTESVTKSLLGKWDWTLFNCKRERTCIVFPNRQWADNSCSDLQIWRGKDGHQKSSSGWCNWSQRGWWDPPGRGAAALEWLHSERGAQRGTCAWEGVLVLTAMASCCWPCSGILRWLRIFVDLPEEEFPLGQGFSTGVPQEFLKTCNRWLFSQGHWPLFS